MIGDHTSPINHFKHFLLSMVCITKCVSLTTPNLVVKQRYLIEKDNLCILEKTVNRSPKIFSSKQLVDALWAYRTAYNKLIGMIPYKLVYRKSCHLLLN